MLSEIDLKEYKTIYQKYFGINLTDKEALTQAISIINLFKIICGFNKNENKNENYAGSKKF